MNGKQIIKRLDRISGSHHIMVYDGLSVSVPVHGGRDLKPGLISGLQKQTGVNLK
jgi:predicted RNA binding protein YcfA (HicA-like mRNA interferase family)